HPGTFQGLRRGQGQQPRSVPRRHGRVRPPTEDRPGLGEREGHDMRALLYGIQPPARPQPDTDNPLLGALARTPMDLVDLPDPPFLLPDWVITKPRLTGICGSDAKQVFMDFGEMNLDNPMRDFSSM